VYFLFKYSRPAAFLTTRSAPTDLSENSKTKVSYFLRQDL
jgi:hypothetical protein